MKLKNYLFLILTLSLLSCDFHKFDDNACEVCGNYYFRYIDKTSVSFCGWTRKAIKKLDGNMHVPEKIYNLNVVEIRVVDKVRAVRDPCESPSYYYEDIKDYMSDVKSVVVPKTVNIIQGKVFDALTDIERITFKKTSNWYAKDSSNSWVSVDVSNPTLNASKLKNVGSLKNIP